MCRAGERQKADVGSKPAEGARHAVALSHWNVPGNPLTFEMHPQEKPAPGASASNSAGGRTVKSSPQAEIPGQGLRGGAAGEEPRVTRARGGGRGCRAGSAPPLISRAAPQALKRYLCSHIIRLATQPPHPHHPTNSHTCTTIPPPVTPARPDAVPRRARRVLPEDRRRAVALDEAAGHVRL